MWTGVRNTSRARRGAEPKRRRSGLAPTLIILALLAAGVATMIYPVVATTWNDHRQRIIAQHFAQTITKADPNVLSEDFKRAQEYNRTLKGAPILDPFIDGVATTQTGAYSAYKAQLSAAGPMARLRVPAVGIDLPVRHGTAPETIATGAGHLYGSSLPVGGPSTHAVITSHTGMANATLFDNLVDVTYGDQVFVDVAGRTLAYQVDDIRVVLPDEASSLKVEKGRDLLTLFTCTPYAVNSHRLMVTGHAVPYEPAADAASGAAAPRFTIPARMMPLLYGAGTGVAVMGFIIAGEVRTSRRHHAKAESGGQVGARRSAG